MGYVDVTFTQIPVCCLNKSREIPSRQELDEIREKEVNEAIMRVVDNGASGDGCNVQIELCPSHYDGKNVVLFFTIPDEQIKVVAEVFASIVRLRQAAGD